METDSTINSLEFLKFIYQKLYSNIKTRPHEHQNIMFLQNNFLVYFCFKGKWSDINMFLFKLAIKKSPFKIYYIKNAILTIRHAPISIRNNVFAKQFSLFFLF